MLGGNPNAVDGDGKALLVAVQHPDQAWSIPVFTNQRESPFELGSPGKLRTARTASADPFFWSPCVGFLILYTAVFAFGVHVRIRCGGPDSTQTLWRLVECL